MICLNKRFPQRGFALVVTLIMVTLAAVIAVALLVNATSERTSATSGASRFGAEVAVQNGLEAAKKALMGSPDAATSVTNEDTFLVLRADGNQTNPSSGAKDSYYYLAKAQPGANNGVDFYPLFSTPSGTPTPTPLPINRGVGVPFPAPAPPVAPFPNPAQEKQGANTKLYPTTYSFAQPAYTQWQELRDPNDKAKPPDHSLPYQRFTFWTEDLAGYLDSSVVGNELSGGLHQRTTGGNPNEIALFTIFDPKNPIDSGQTAATTLINKRPALVTVPTLAQVASVTPDVTQPNLAARLGIDMNGEQNLIPFGFGYLDEGKPKTNVNTVITSSQSDDGKVTTLSTVIDNNLKNFATTRRGGLPASQVYTKTIAANMLGYATGKPILGTGYRGIGLHPFVVEFYERFIWQHNGSETTNFYLKNGTWWVDVKATGFVELWNMTNRPIDSGTMTFTDLNRFYAYVGGTSDPHPFEDQFGVGTMSFGSSTTLQPDEYKVFKIYEHVYNFDTGLTARPTGSAATVYLGTENGPKIDPTTCGYLVDWNGVRVDQCGSGSLNGARGDGSDSYSGAHYVALQRSYANLNTPGSASDPTWRGTLPGLRYDDLSEMNYNLGDPRSAYYIIKSQANAAYASSGSGSYGQSSWWGRIYQDGLVNHSNWKAAETTISGWPDGGHDSAKGLTPSTTAADPTTLTPIPASEPNKAPVIMSSAGKYISITEIGRVYDPIQWRPSNFPPASHSDFITKWQNAWKTNMASDSNYGCASTLHIGSPEFANFDTDDARAARLLDLFSVSDRLSTRGLLNLNTASREALRALAAGIKINSNSVDGAMTPTTVDGPLLDPSNPIQADKFADAVIRNRPFLSTSQLSGLMTDPTDRTTSFFGNLAQWTSAGPTEWSDAAREDYFARMFNLTTVRSRNFRVFVTGQIVDPRIKDPSGNPTVLSTVNRVYQVFLHPTRDASGKITAQSCDVTYEKDL